MQGYELILLFDPNLGEEKIGQFGGKVEEKIKGWGGTVDKTEKWGARRLASMIRKAKKLTQAYYVLIRFQSASSVPAELRAFLKVSESVVRYFLSLAEAIETISETPAAATEVPEIKGEPLGESK